MVETFGQRLQERIRALGPLCVGIDPSRQLLESWGRTDSVEGLEFFAMAVLEAVSDVAAAVKPQVAFFERFGAEGYRVLERLIKEARDAHVMIIGDAKRGDIESSNTGYAEAWLGERSPLCCDAVTVNPYLGLAALAPFVRAASDTGRGVFVLAATSNSDDRAIQSARTPENVSVEELVLREVATLNERAEGLGSFGIVIGGTRDKPNFDLPTLGGPFLVPGVGLQGATPENVARLFDRCPAGTVLPSVSRAILQAGPERASLRDAAQRWRDDLSGVLP
jgi:orotidine-5'-phosphate decarboxylase